MISRRAVLVVILALATPVPAAPDRAEGTAPVGSAFTYQGELSNAGAPASGPYDFSFGLFTDPTAAEQVGSTILRDEVDVAQGLFTVELDFGFGAFDGDQLWLQVGVRPGADTNPHTLLVPRQKLTATPYAVQARFVAPGAVGALEIDATQVQVRVSGTCPAGSQIIAVGQNGSVTCGPAGGGACYTHWGDTTCAAGYSAVVAGRTGGLEHFTATGGSAAPSLECISGTAPTVQAFAGTYNNRMFRGNLDGSGMDEIAANCAVCCTGGCYTAWSSSTCATGYTAVYVGRAGGIEAYSSAHRQESQCIDGGAAASTTYPTGYSTRIFRHRPPAGGGANGMDQVANTCAVCCKQ